VHTYGGFKTVRILLWFECSCSCFSWCSDVSGIMRSHTRHIILLQHTHVTSSYYLQHTLFTSSYYLQHTHMCTYYTIPSLYCVGVHVCAHACVQCPHMYARMLQTLLTMQYLSFDFSKSPHTPKSPHTHTHTHMHACISTHADLSRLYCTLQNLIFCIRLPCVPYMSII
jgi:hypothetical protein